MFVGFNVQAKHMKAYKREHILIVHLTHDFFPGNYEALQDNEITI
jgi:hypothetical protein